jgi:putative chitinase
MDITLEQFQEATGSDAEHAETYYMWVLEAMHHYEIDRDPGRIAAFCGTIGVESTRLSKVEEDLYYRSPERLVAIFPSKFPTVDSARPYCRMPADLSHKLYNGYHGRGLIQLTWERNYRVHGDRLGADFVNNPELLLTPQWAAMSAGSFWDLNNCNDVAYDMGEVTLRVNGRARLHLAERIALRNQAMAALEA